MADADEWLAELERELDARSLRIGRVVLAVAMLALVALWCISQQVVP